MISAILCRARPLLRRQWYLCERTPQVAMAPKSWKACVRVRLNYHPLTPPWIQVANQWITVKLVCYYQVLESTADQPSPLTDKAGFQIAQEQATIIWWVSAHILKGSESSRASTQKRCRYHLFQPALPGYQMFVATRSPWKGQRGGVCMHATGNTWFMSVQHCDPPSDISNALRLPRDVVANQGTSVL
jgi:hypothetical protein